MTVNVIFLAAGQGTRLRPYTETMPKGMVPLLDKPLIIRNMAEWEKIEKCSFHFVTGYCSQVIEELGHTTSHNPEFDQTNMVWSLACALDHINNLSSDFVYISYADIIVHNANLKMLVDAGEAFCVPIDLKWQDLWSLRMDDYSEDVETLMYDDIGITSIGQKPLSPDQVQGQYIGLMKFKRELLVEMLSQYLTWVHDAAGDQAQQERKNIYMTDFIQNYIDNEGVVTPIFINGGWLEVDTIEDLKIYESAGTNMPFLKKLFD